MNVKKSGNVFLLGIIEKDPFHSHAAVFLVKKCCKQIVKVIANAVVFPYKSPVMPRNRERVIKHVTYNTLLKRTWLACVANKPFKRLKKYQKPVFTFVDGVLFVFRPHKTLQLLSEVAYASYNERSYTACQRLYFSSYFHYSTLINILSMFKDGQQTKRVRE